MGVRRERVRGERVRGERVTVRGERVRNAVSVPPLLKKEQSQFSKTQKTVTQQEGLLLWPACTAPIPLTGYSSGGSV